jgi:probable rRNA maturation factor
MILVEADCPEEWDSSTDWRALAEASVRAAVEASNAAALLDGALVAEVSVRFTDNDEVKALNSAWRGKEKATNVLSFPMFEPPLVSSLPDLDGGEVLLGDIVLAHGVCASEAAEKGIPVRSHAAHLLVHGTLHLLGYEHEGDDARADEMEEVERRALAAMGVADPYEVHGG